MIILLAKTKFQCEVYVCKKTVSHFKFIITVTMFSPDITIILLIPYMYSKTCVKRPLSKRPKIGFQDQLSLNAGLTFCRILQGEHSAILSTFIGLPFAIKIFVLSIFEWPYCTLPSDTGY